jgi:Glycine-zipper domain
MKIAKQAALVGAALLLGGCVSMPSGPSVMTLPGSGKSFDQFRNDDMNCRQYANSQVGGTPNDAAASSVASSAAIGTVIGAAAGAAFGGHNGAAAGAGTGLLFGSLVGASNGTYSQYEVQRRYDNGYLQCMYSLGHKIPSYGHVENASRPMSHYPPPPPPPPGASAPPSSQQGGTPPPPPAGTPPPPPPGAN